MKTVANAGKADRFLQNFTLPYWMHQRSSFLQGINQMPVGGAWDHSRQARQILYSGENSIQEPAAGVTPLILPASISINADDNLRIGDFGLLSVWPIWVQERLQVRWESLRGSRGHYQISDVIYFCLEARMHANIEPHNSGSSWNY